MISPLPPKKEEKVVVKTEKKVAEKKVEKKVVKVEVKKGDERFDILTLKSFDLRTFLQVFDKRREDIFPRVPSLPQVPPLDYAAGAVLGVRSSDLRKISSLKGSL